MYNSIETNCNLTTNNFDGQMEQTSCCQRIMNRILLRKEKKHLNQRTIHLNKIRRENYIKSFKKSHSKKPYKSNYISTAKYEFYNFLFLFLYEQFHIYSNIFFLAISAIQQIPDISPTGRFTTLIPLVFILTISAFKELIEDWKRHRNDDKVNNSSVVVLINGEWCTKRCKNVEVGDIVKISSGNVIPADLLLISSSEPRSLCYLETSNLDGETNLKLKLAIKQTCEFTERADLVELEGCLECELPNKKLFEFSGVLKIVNESIPVGNDQILQRGCTLRNTDWICGVAIYTGQESKIMMNSAKGPMKRTAVTREVNKMIIILMIILFLLALSSSVISNLWDLKDYWYLSGLKPNGWMYYFYNFLTFIVLFNNIIPISLQVTLECVRFAQTFFINWDEEMYSQRFNNYATARTSNLNEELGQIEYVFSDKTGTLTQNEMILRFVTVGKCQFRFFIDEDNPPSDDKFEFSEYKSDPASSNNSKDSMRNSGSSSNDEHYTFDADKVHSMDSKLDEDVKQLYKRIVRLLSICHTVIPYKSLDSPTLEISYQASSPDEETLVYGASLGGYSMTNRNPETITIEEFGTPKTWNILNILDFNSYRKRMSIIVQDPNDGSIYLFTKGADSVIYERLHEHQMYINKELIMSQLNVYASVGYRTLVLAQKKIRQIDYDAWHEQYREASISMEKRSSKLDSVSEMIEKDLQLIGASAIEDKLQDEVPETIMNLIDAKIKIWMLTGDKLETAISIGYSCGLIMEKDKTIILDNANLMEVENFLYEQKNKNHESTVLVLDGNSLRNCFDKSILNKFANFTFGIKRVICCRATPAQKAELVHLVKKRNKSTTLAIGDGANDVGMIKMANIGVGLMGHEGLQACAVSDYAISEFKHLNRLLFVHGCWNYDRITKVILFSFYKNMCLFIIGFWFAFKNAFSGQIIIESWSLSMYNVFFTMMTPLSLGIFDKFVEDKNALKYPEIYSCFQRMQHFNIKVFLIWLLDAIYHSLVIYWSTTMFLNKEISKSNGTIGDFIFVGNFIYAYVVTTVTLHAGLLHNRLNIFAHISIWGSIIMWVIFINGYSHVWPTFEAGEQMKVMAMELFSTPLFWFGWLLVPILTLANDIFMTITKRLIQYQLKDKISSSELQKIDMTSFMINKTRSGFINTMKRMKQVFYLKSDTPKSTSSLKHGGYAFSQTENAFMSQRKVMENYDTYASKPSGM